MGGTAVVFGQHAFERFCLSVERLISGPPFPGVRGASLPGGEVQEGRRPSW